MLRIASNKSILRLPRSSGVIKISPVLTQLHLSSSASSSDIDVKLREDVKTLGRILGNSIKEHNPQVFEAVEKLRRLGREVI